MLNRTLAAELIEMANADQRARKKAWKVGVLDTSFDRKNTAALKKILDRYGWPTVTLVGKRASARAWLLAMHTDLSPTVQRKCLHMMKIAYKKKLTDVDSTQIKHLGERIEYNKKRLWRLL